MSEHLVWLDDPECHLPEVAGGKGASLARMRAAGMPVPPGFVVTAAAFDHSLAGHGLQPKIAGLAAGFEPGSEGSRIARDIQGLVLGTPLAGDLIAQVSGAYAGLGSDVPVAVRSSAASEDGEVASFAGQQETYLNVVGPDEVLERVVECWASFFSERALFYRQSKGSLSDLGMAVVVQQQIASDKSGVMFTTDPIRRRSDQMVIEAVFGLGEALVSGLSTPDHYVAKLDGTVKKARVGRQDQMIARDPSGGTRTLDLDAAKAAARVLGDDEIARLVALGLKLQEAFGSPQDVEWAFEADELFALQSRPITA
ncbi:MAG: PEP/pyruvate-binding domain-containing protein [Acidimicrobiia bacterium]